MHSRLISAVALTFAITAQFAYAQGRGRVPIRFQEMDKNNDGIVQRAEWTGTTASFRTHDWNRDGMLSGDELRIGRGRGNQNNPNRDFGSAYEEYDYDDWTTEGFTRLDRNRDSRITRDEWYYASDSFALADHDRNGSISRAEFLSEGTDAFDDDREDRFRYLDGNNDGRVSRSEWHGAVALFNVMDKNRDGFLTRDETGRTEAPPDLFTSLDANRDRYLTFAEWSWSRPSFNQRDGNGDGRLSREEFLGAATPAPNVTSAYRAGYDRGLIDGRTAGHQDRAINHYWDLEGQRELDAADAGYAATVGPKDQYQAGYRDAFRRAYAEEWNKTTGQ